MRRKLLNLAAAVSASISLFATASWMSSYWYLTGGSAARVWMIEVITARGRVSVELMNDGRKYPWYGRFARIPAGAAGKSWGRWEQLEPWHFAQFGLRYERNPALAGSIRLRLVFPHWFVVGFGVLLPAVVLRRWYKRRGQKSAGLCPTCGYDLRATPDRCPECGTRAVMLNDEY